MSTEQELTPTEELFLVALETSKTTKEASESVGLSHAKGYTMVSKLKDIIIDRARTKLAGLTLRSVGTVEELLGADSLTEKGELRLKTAEGIMDRTGLTKHTNVDVEIESTNGIFLIPSKTVVPEEPSEEPEESMPSILPR
jgi:hypothetical protein